MNEGYNESGPQISVSNHIQEKGLIRILRPMKTKAIIELITR